MSKSPITEQPSNNPPPPYQAGGYSNSAYNTQYNSGYGGNAVQMQPVQGSYQPTQASGAEMLANLQKIHVHQEVHLIEESECCERQCCGPIRAMTMNISTVTTAGEVPLIFLNRPRNCQGCCCPCCLQVMEIQFPIGKLAATIKEVWTCCIPKYEIYDANGSLLFQIVGDCCVCKCCTDVHFKILKGDMEIGDIQKHWGGFREVCGKANDFSIIFNDKSESVTNKAILLGATFLIDFNYFEHND
ncbi:DgyrCDS2143 [Dimorphilus gyrociliatus]|uniref:Phospholipid scramblase n=1 Tax=Dimorphilus gyrociliatus TaxID=2664684 RepID=A0A7I8V9C5_9ANNE|nr:DgyrCDS2143 [Dimorphilus gyrociliatus]